ncbi:hypothetical protein HKX48_006801 [Thoreauomyces humboldtii]|nr:hypothetical protein HKX48_006801 [Thoreauomyces humboldtii]
MRYVLLAVVVYMTCVVVSSSRHVNRLVIDHPVSMSGSWRVKSSNPTDPSPTCDWIPQSLHPAAKFLGQPSGLSFALEDAWVRSDSPRVSAKDFEASGSNVIPAALPSNYRVNVTDWDLKWDAETLNEAIREDWGGDADTPVSPHAFAVMSTHADKLRNKSGLLLGPHRRWFEALALKYGARHVSTLESPIDDPGAFQHKSVTRYDSRTFNSKFLSGSIETFDFAWSYSFLELEGVAAQFNPDPKADLHHMARMLSILKPGGFLFVGMPCCMDAVYLDSLRTYGPRRLQSLLAGWHVVEVYPNDFLTHVAGQGAEYFQPIWVLQNTLGCANSHNSQALDLLMLNSSTLAASINTSRFDVRLRNADDNLTMVTRTAQVFDLFNMTTTVPQLAQLTPARVDNRLGLDALIRDYVKLNREARENPRNARWIVMQCTESGNGGLGDRFKGIVSMFYYGLMTGRAFAIDWTYPDLLQDYLAPNMIDWRWQSAWGFNRSGIYVDMLGEAWRDERRMNLISNHTDFWGTHEIVRMRSRVDLISFILQNRHWEETILRYSLKTFNRESLAGIVLRALFKPSAAALENLELLDQRIFNYRKSKKVALQFRAGAGSGEAAFAGDEVAHRLGFDAANCFTAQGIQYALNQRLLAHETVFFLTGDSSKALEMMGDQLSALGFRSFTTTGDMTHIDFAAHEPPNDHRMLHMRTYLDWLIMLDMDYLVTSRSGFGETAIYFTLDQSARITKNKHGGVPPCEMQMGNNQSDWVFIEGWNGDQHGGHVTHANN